MGGDDGAGPTVTLDDGVTDAPQGRVADDGALAPGATVGRTA